MNTKLTAAEYNKFTKMIVQRFRALIACYGMTNQSGILAWILDAFVSCVTGYNHKKYWQRRAYVINGKQQNILLKAYYIYYLKRIDAKHLSSTGYFYNSGAVFSTPPHLPHGLNRIIVGHDAKIGANVTFFQGVTVSHGGCIIGDNVVLGANCVILPNIRIGDNAKIGANCVVVEDVPNNATCVMNKPRIIKK